MDDKGNQRERVIKIPVRDASKEDGATAKKDAPPQEEVVGEEAARPRGGLKSAREIAMEKLARIPLPEHDEEERESFEEVRKKAAERDELMDRLKRALADFSNYKNRMQKERESWGDRVLKDFALELLPILDNFDRALLAAEKSKDFAGLVEGVHMVHGELSRILASHGVKSIEAEGQPFDPRYHKAMLTEMRDDLENQTVLEEILRGYLFKDQVLRPSEVKVSIQPTDEKAAETAGGEAEEGGRERAP
jgi:molecular chaperone GrpE